MSFLEQPTTKYNPVDISNTIDYQMRMESGPSLIELGLKHFSIIQTIVASEGEISDELAQELESLGDITAAKIEAYAWVLDRMELEASYWRAKAERYMKIARGLESADERMKENLKKFMSLAEIESVSGIDMEFRLIRSGTHLDTSNMSIDEIPMDFVKVKKELDKAKIKTALESGESVNGVVLVPTIQLRRYLKKRELL